MSCRYKGYLLFLKEVTQLPQHSSPRFTLRALSIFILYSLFFFSFWTHHIALICSLLFPVRPVPSQLSSVWSLFIGRTMETLCVLAKMHLSTTTRPYSFLCKKGPKHLELFSFPAARHWHGKAQVWVCVAETGAFYRLEETRVDEWQTRLY